MAQIQPTYEVTADAQAPFVVVTSPAEAEVVVEQGAADIEVLTGGASSGSVGGASAEILNAIAARVTAIEESITYGDTEGQEIAYAPNISIDLAGVQTLKVYATGAINFTAINPRLGRKVLLMVFTAEAPVVVTFPEAWRTQGTRPTQIPANDWATILFCAIGSGSTDIGIAFDDEKL